MQSKTFEVQHLADAETAINAWLTANSGATINYVSIAPIHNGHTVWVIVFFTAA